MTDLYSIPVVWACAKLYKSPWDPDKWYASVRDYIVKDAIAKRTDLLIKHKDSFMLVPYPDLVEFLKGKHQFHSKIFEEKVYPNTKYQLYDFPWGKWKVVTTKNGK